MRNQRRPSPTPRRFPKRRGALFGACAACGILLLAVSQRAISQFSLFSDSVMAPRTPAPENKAEKERNGSLSKALSQIDAPTVRAYLERWSNPQKMKPVAAGGAVYIDADALARRHPAWRLADDLEKGAISPSAPRLARVLETMKAETVKAANFPAKISLEARQLVFGRELPATIWRANETRFSARTFETRELDRFLKADEAREALRARDESFLARRAVEDAVELSQRARISEMELPVLPPDVALELLNLRLELLRNLARTPVQRAASRAEIGAIEARYAAILGRQTELQAAGLRAATLEIPARARREGLLQIERESQISAQKNAEARRALALETRNLRRRDFASPAPLQLTLPPVRPLFRPLLPVQTSLPLASSARARAQSFETARLANASDAPLEAKTVASSRERAEIVTRLRLKARRDAAQWARRSATHLGATWSADPTARDATAQALGILFPAAAR